MLLQAFLNRENVVHPTTATNLQAQKNKIAAAKEHGYSVMLVLVERPVEQALDQVRQRVAKGGHDVNIDKIVSSNAIAKSNFNLLAPLVDIAKIVS
jgi:predicted ABC-type ATPase